MSLMAAHLQTTVNYLNCNNNTKSVCNLSHPCVIVNTSRPSSSMGGNLTPGSVTPGRCSTPVNLTPGRCSTPVNLTPGRCSTPVSMTPGRSTTPVCVTPGRCSTPVSMTPVWCTTPSSMTPGRCTPVSFISRKYYSDILAASTASTVAIDNKIEQAMDLVKSHLMFAVREEVDVLKEKIVELMDRINHLECENNLLRQYASPDVIQQLQSQIPHQMQQPPHHTSTS